MEQKLWLVRVDLEALVQLLLPGGDDLEEEEVRMMLVREAWAHHWMKVRVLEWKVASRDPKVLLQTKSIIFIH